MIMNERIQELYAKACLYARDKHFEDKDVPAFIQCMSEKFAELIVRECAEQSISIGRYNTPSNVTPDLAIAISVGLKKHFGVE